ncbi:MAG: glucosyl-3-phosphoglycerate synthase [Acidimicrobiales bacterium]
MLTFQYDQFPAAAVAESKRGRRISVCVPALNEAATVGHVVETVRAQLMDAEQVVDELVVVDDGSLDATRAVAEAAGATVVAAAVAGAPGGKGHALWQGLRATTGDLVVFCDADVISFHPGFVTGLVGPLLAHEHLSFVKATYRRDAEGHPGEGGRVTELLARPLIELLFPQLAGIRQPLAGECAARREALEAVPFVDGYAVDLGLVLDLAARFGVSSLAQCDLGTKEHRNRPISELAAQARSVAAVALHRSGNVLQGASAALVSQRPPVRELQGRRISA